MSRITPIASKRIVWAVGRMCFSSRSQAVGEPAQTRALARAQPHERLLVGADPLPPGVHATGLHLGEHERTSVEGDQVDLAVARTFVAADRREPEPVHVGRRVLLAAAAERRAPVGIAWFAACCGGVRGLGRGIVGGHDHNARSQNVT